MIDDGKEPQGLTKLSAGVYTPGSFRIVNKDVSLTRRGDQLILSSDLGSFTLSGEELKAALIKEDQVDRPAGLIPAQNSSTDKFPFEAIPGKEREGHLSADPEISNPVVNVGLRQLIEAEYNKGQSSEDFKNAVIDLVQKDQFALKSKLKSLFNNWLNGEEDIDLDDVK